MAGQADVIKVSPERSLWRYPPLLGLVALVLAWLTAWLIGSSIAARRLTSELERRFAAEVRIGALHYWPPYWLEARDVVLSSDLGGEQVAWVELGSLHASLAWLPFAEGSVQLADLVVREPVLSVVRDAAGVHDPLDLWRGDAQAPPRALPVRHVTADGARVVIHDRTTPSAPSLELGAFTLHLDASAAGDQVFAFTLGGGDARLAVASAGTLDVARRTLTVAKLGGNVRLGSSDAAQDTASEASISAASGTIDLAARSGRVAGGSVLIAGEPPLTLEDVHASFALSPGRIDASDAGARVASGTVSGKLTLSWSGAAEWQASGNAVDLDLAQLAPRFPELGGRSVKGQLTGRGSFAGVVTADSAKWLDALRGEGSARARAGQFYRVPLIAKLLEQSHFTSQAATLSDAAASFRIDARTIHFDNAALGSASVGVQGQGDVGFDGRLALEMVVVPLGDWQASVARSNVPLVGDALASLVGKVQSLFGKASALVYQFRVSGTVEDPQLIAVPVPVLTNTAAAVFGRMVTVGWDGDVLGN